MKIKPLKLPGVYEISLSPIQDDRGYFKRTYDVTIFSEHGLTTAWVQENEACSTRQGIIRGMHFQNPPHAETKLVRVAVGAIYDVFVDIRKDSPTFGQWGAAEISAEKHNMVYIPKGFAHGYCTLTDLTVVLYKVDEVYAPQSEGGLRWNDPTIGIKWPNIDPVLSDKDNKSTLFKDFVSPF